MDEDANARNGPRISGAGSRVAVWVIPTNEELMIARHTGVVLGLLEDRRVQGSHARPEG
jgi:acetate kinase